MGTPSQSSNSSSTRGSRKGLILLGSAGPGINPTRTVFSILYLSSLGKFNIVKYLAPMLYCVCSNGLNQSIFSASPTLLGASRNGRLDTNLKSFHILPSIMSLKQPSVVTNLLHSLHQFNMPGRSNILLSALVILLYTKVFLGTSLNVVPHLTFFISRAPQGFLRCL